MANYQVLSEDAIRYICGLIRDMSSISDAIDDINIRSDGTFSSVKIDKMIKQCLKDGKNYADEVCAALIKLTCKKTTIQPTLENSETNVIYLYSDSGKAPFEQWLKISNNELIDMGSTSIKMDDYYGKDIIDEKFALKSNLIDVINKIGSTTLTTTDKTLSGAIEELHTNISDHSSDNVIHITQEERDKLITTDDVATTISNTSTDTQVPSAKSVYDATSNFRKTYTSIEQLGLTSGSETMENIANNMESFTRLIAVIEGGTSIYPHTYGTLIVEKLNIYRVHFKFCLDELPVVYVGTYHAVSGFTGWKRLCSTSVADVPLTNVTIPDGLFQSVNEVSYIKYEVVNGIAFVYFNIREAKFVKSGVSRNITVPKIKSPFNHTIIGENINTNLTILANGNNMQLWALGDETMVTHYSACISYPVAES